MPRSLFHDDGKLLLTKDKNVILLELEHLYPEINFTTLTEENESVIFDGMAVVNRIDIQKQKGIIKTCQDFADVFSKIILKEHQGFPDVRVLFDRYDKLYLKSKTSEDRSSGIQIQSRIEDDTNIESITSEKFLSHVNTKRDLTKYLSCKIAQVLSAAGKQYVVTYNSTAESNIIDFPEELKFHSHEEADTLIVLHSIEVAKRNPFCQLYVACSDTDVLLLLLYFYPQICNNTVFQATTGEIDIGYACNALQNKKSMGLLGFHAFTGRFSGFSKTTCFNTFLKSNSFEYKAFASLGNYDNRLKEIIDGLTQFVLELYQSKRPSNINTLG